MIRKFRVRIGGEEYEVEVEEISEAAAPTVRGSETAVHRETQTGVKPEPLRPSVQPAAKVAPAAVAVGADTTGETVIAPLPGVLLELRVQTGDAVHEGQVVAILEAMKMENEITAPVSGNVVATPTAPGESVELGAILAIIQP